MADVNFNYWLGQKYTQLQQQADAVTKNANTNAVTGLAGANLDTVKARLLPAESAASVRQTDANANLLGEQAKVVAPVAMADIAKTNAETGYTTTQDKVLTRQALTPLGKLLGPSLGALSSVLGPRGYQGFSLGNVVPPEPPVGDPSRAAWLNQINGL